MAKDKEIKFFVTKKEELEYLKLEAELHELKKPIYHKTGFYMAIASIFVTAIGYAVTLSTGYLSVLHDANLKELESKRTLLKAENESLDQKKDLLEQQIKLFELEKKGLAKEKALLAEKNAKLDEEYKKKHEELDEQYENKYLVLKKELSNKEKVVDKIVNLRFYLKGERLDLKMPLPKETLGETPEETAKNLQQYLNALTQVKTETEYSFDDWYYKGAAEFDTGKYKEAIDSFKKALPNSSDDAGTSYTYNYIGAAYQRQGKDEEALKEYDKSIKLKPDNPLPYTNKAFIYLRHNRIDDAEEEINLAIKWIKEEKVEERQKPFFNDLIKRLKKKLEDARNKKE